MVDQEWVYTLTISKRSDKQWLRFKGGGRGGGVWQPPTLARYVNQNGLTIEGFKSLTKIVKVFSVSVECYLLRFEVAQKATSKAGKDISQKALTKAAELASAEAVGSIISDR